MHPTLLTDLRPTPTQAMASHASATTGDAPDPDEAVEDFGKVLEALAEAEASEVPDLPLPKAEVSKTQNTEGDAAEEIPSTAISPKRAVAGDLATEGAAEPPTPRQATRAESREAPEVPATPGPVEERKPNRPVTQPLLPLRTEGAAPASGERQPDLPVVRTPTAQEEAKGAPPVVAATPHGAGRPDGADDLAIPGLQTPPGKQTAAPVWNQPRSHPLPQLISLSPDQPLPRDSARGQASAPSVAPDHAATPVKPETVDLPQRTAGLNNVSQAGQVPKPSAEGTAPPPSGHRESALQTPPPARDGTLPPEKLAIAGLSQRDNAPAFWQAAGKVSLPFGPPDKPARDRAREPYDAMRPTITAAIQTRPKPQAGTPLVQALPLQALKAAQKTAEDPKPLFQSASDSPLAQVGRAEPQQATAVTAPIQTVRGELPAPALRQIAEALHNSAPRQVEITLSPEELGRVRLSLSPSENGMIVNVLTERGDTLDLMRRHIQSLEAAFQAIGYADISFSFAGQDSGTGAEEDHIADPRTISVENAHSEETTRTPALTPPMQAQASLDLRL